MDTLGNMAALTEISAIKVVAPSAGKKSSTWLSRFTAVQVFLVIPPLTGFFAQARSLRLADGPDEVHKGMIAKIGTGETWLRFTSNKI